MAYAMFLACVLFLLALGSEAGPGKAPASVLKDVDTILTKLADSNLFSGMTIVVKGGKEELMHKSYGMLIPELGVKLRPNLKYGIGSNGKGVTGVIMYILQAKGLLNTNDTIDKYVKPQDFNISSWCPRVVNMTTGPCVYPRIHQLLSHQSGLIDVALHCRYPYDSWQAQYCWGGSRGDSMPLHYTTRLAYGAVPTKELVRNSGLFTAPLLWMPGTTYDDNNNNFVIAAYIAELVTGMTWSDVYSKYLYEAVGMKDTFIDLSQGNDGVHRNMVATPGYTTYLSPLSLGSPSMDFDSIGDKTINVGDLVSAKPEGPPYGTWAKTARAVDPVVASFGFNVMHAGGAMYSTLRDQAKYFTTLTRQPQKIGLNRSLLRTIFTLGSPYGPFQFAQGYATKINLSLPFGTPFVYYEGNFGYSVSSYTDLHPTDPSKDVHVSFVTYTAPLSYFFKFAFVPTNTTAPADNRLDPITPYIGQKVCTMSVKEDPSWYTPNYGWIAGNPVRSKTAFDYYFAKAKAAGSPLGNGKSVPAPHIFCNITEAGTSLGRYLTSLLADAALGRPWGLYIPKQ